METGEAEQKYWYEKLMKIQTRQNKDKMFRETNKKVTKKLYGINDSEWKEYVDQREKKIYEQRWILEEKI